MAENNANDHEIKRQAMTGQWRTPPLPTFGHTAPQISMAPQLLKPLSSGDILSSITVPANPLQDVPMPESTDDYAKALQEAYRRGAEAAALLQQQQMQSAQSCPNLQYINHQQQSPPHQEMPTLMQQYQQPMQIQQQNHLQHIQIQQHQPMETQQYRPMETPQYQPIETAQQKPSSVCDQNSMPSVVPNPLAPIPPSSAQSQAVHLQMANSNASRSVSLPDMQSYAARAQAEEEKRKKRLARNRASARLRRLRKKNLVDSYEGEVGVLEASLRKLKAHSWGSHASHEALLEALSMERGQQEISEEQRQQLLREIVEQQLQQALFLQEAQMEQSILQLAVVQPDDELSRELQELLQLTPQQQQEIFRATLGLNKEVEALDTLVACLQAMQSTEWLTNEGVTALTKEFTSILHPNQLSKFLLWTDANAEAIEQLDYCNAPPGDASPQTSPTFCFGIDDHGSST